MNREKAIEIIGEIGEKIVMSTLIRCGRIVEQSIDHFDSEKDLSSGKKKIEVKTQQPHVLKNAFTFRAPQLKKCLNVDELYIVSIPPLFDKNFKHGGKIFTINPKSFLYFDYITKQGIKMVGIPIEQDDVHWVRDLTKQEISELMKYASSAYER